MSEQIDYEHRSFFGTAAMSIAAAQVGMMGSARAQTGNSPPTKMTRRRHSGPPIIALREAHRLSRLADGISDTPSEIYGIPGRKRGGITRT
jgi:hypothetical protein